MLPELSLDQVRASLCYYAEYPDEVDQVLVDSQPEAIKAQLYRMLGPEAYRHITDTSDAPRVTREAYARYGDPDEPQDEDG